MKPEEKQLLNNTIESVNKLSKQLNGFLDIYFRTHFIDKWVLRDPLVLRNTKILIEGDNGLTIGNEPTDKLGFFGAAPAVQQTAPTADLTHITHSAPGTPDYAIQDLTQTTPYGFVTKDEGNSVLKVVQNLQVRVKELEDMLSNLGLSA